MVQRYLKLIIALPNIIIIQVPECICLLIVNLIRRLKGAPSLFSCWMLSMTTFLMILIRKWSTTMIIISFNIILVSLLWTKPIITNVFILVKPLESTYVWSHVPKSVLFSYRISSKWLFLIFLIVFRYALWILYIDLRLLILFIWLLCRLRSQIVILLLIFW